MTQDEIIEMARQAGLMPTVLIPWSFEIHKFAKLVAAKEREACAIVCDNLEHTDPEYYQFEPPTSHECADAIRMRGEA